MEEGPLMLPIFKEDVSGYEGVLLPHRIMALAAIQVNVVSLEDNRTAFILFLCPFIKLFIYIYILAKNSLYVNCLMFCILF
jgi:hypothetical protein